VDAFLIKTLLIVSNDHALKDERYSLRFSLKKMLFAQAIHSLKILLYRIRAFDSNLSSTDFQNDITDDGLIVSLYSRLNEVFLFLRSKEALIEADKHAQYLHYELALRYYSEVACFQSTSIANQYYNNAGVCLAKNGKLIEAFDCMRMVIMAL
jgi:hypothetical protein